MNCLVEEIFVNVVGSGSNSLCFGGDSIASLGNKTVFLSFGLRQKLLMQMSG